MEKQAVIDRVNQIATIANSCDNGYHYEVIISDWENYGKNRTYFKIEETRDNSKHCKAKDYGYFDNIANTYVPGKSNIDFDFGGNNRI